YTWLHEGKNMLFGGVPDIKKLEEKKDVKGLIRVLQSRSNSDKWKSARVDAVNSLGVLGDKQAVESLIAVLYDTDVLIRMRAIDVLGKLGDPRAVDPLITILNDDDNIIRDYAIHALGALGKASIKAVPKLKVMLNNDQHTAQALIEIGDPNTLDILIDYIHRRTRHLTVDNEGILNLDNIVDVIKALGDLANPQAIPVLISAYNKFSNKFETAKKYIITVLQKIRLTETDPLDTLIMVLQAQDTFKTRGNDITLRCAVAQLLKPQANRMS
ncbi:MAG TPA: HEAT repeat domain-containing protein, partial [Aggregatilineales bacterium]|nr:HEAT repeat domain-containing protein [Aggregatilineales bacterium]